MACESRVNAMMRTVATVLLALLVAQGPAWAQAGRQALTVQIPFPRGAGGEACEAQRGVFQQALEQQGRPIGMTGAESLWFRAIERNTKMERKWQESLATLSRDVLEARATFTKADADRVDAQQRFDELMASIAANEAMLARALAAEKDLRRRLETTFERHIVVLFELSYDDWVLERPRAYAALRDAWLPKLVLPSLNPEAGEQSRALNAVIFEQMQVGDVKGLAQPLGEPFYNALPADGRGYPRTGVVQVIKAHPLAEHDRSLTRAARLPGMRESEKPVILDSEPTVVEHRDVLGPRLVYDTVVMVEQAMAHNAANDALVWSIYEDWVATVYDGPTSGVLKRRLAENRERVAWEQKILAGRVRAADLADQQLALANGAWQQHVDDHVVIVELRNQAAVFEDPLRTVADDLVVATCLSLFEKAADIGAPAYDLEAVSEDGSLGQTGESLDLAIDKLELLPLGTGLRSGNRTVGALMVGHFRPVAPQVADASEPREP